jgi:hypothetical protein
MSWLSQIFWLGQDAFDLTTSLLYGKLVRTTCLHPWEIAMKFVDLLLRVFVVLVFVALGLVFGRLIPHMEATDLDPIEIEVVQGPESFVTFNAWMQHLQMVNRYVDLNRAIVAKKPEQPVALMDPYFAKKYLRGDAWVAWALQYNERAREVGAGQRTEVIRGTTTRVETHRGTTTITTTPAVTRKIYTSGPRTIYNPYCPPRE